MNAAPVDLSERFPRPDRRLALGVTPDALRQIRGRSPWVYDRSITSIRCGDHQPTAGDLGVVFDTDRSFAAIGLFDPHSPIRLRILAEGAPVGIDERFFERKVAAALALRQGLADDPSTSAYRCLNGENDGFGGLVADLYNDTLVLKAYTAAWFPWLDLVLSALMTVTNAENAILRLARSVSRQVPDLDGIVLAGRAPAGPLVILENGLRLHADVVSGQKTGHFLDQRDNRSTVREMVRATVRDGVGASATGGMTMLDVFSCTGGFALNAAAGGATEITCIDRSEEALRAASSNFALNVDVPSVAAASVETIVGDAFEQMERLASAGRRFATVVVDPPSFTPRKSARERAEQSYRTLASLSIAVTEPGGILMNASCSARIPTDRFEALIAEALARSGRNYQIVARSGHAIDHPVTFDQGAYLKSVFTRFMD